MKNKDLKKGKESIIGKIIYGFLLFMPLLAILSTILYTTFNKNAYQSYYGKTINEKQIVYVNEDNIELNETYIFTGNTINYLADTNYNRGNTYFGFYIKEENELYPQLEANTNYYMGVYMPSGSSSNTWGVSETINGTNILSRPSNTGDLFNMELVVTSYNFSINDILEDTQILGLYKYNSLSYLNDSFYYAVDKVENSNLFNWTTNSLIYTGIANTCTQLSITTTFIPLLLAYWLIISVIYILYDIILMILIILHNKVHRLQDSI